MKHIIKRMEPKEFSDWKALKNDNWTSSWDNLMNPEKHILLNSLINEQNYLCCYCGIDMTKGKCHIEHLRPRERYAHYSLDYNNLLASCDGILHDNCGHKKGNWYDEEKMISPLDNCCKDYFVFTSAGEILPSGEPDKKEKAKETITRLNLNSEGLIIRRKKALEGILDIIDESTTDEILRFIEYINQPDADHKLTQFCFVIDYVLRKYI